MQNPPKPTYPVGPTPLTIEQILDLSMGRATAELSTEPAFRRHFHQGVSALHRRLESGKPIYGVTTGFGDSCETHIPMQWTADLPTNLVRFHGAGTGQLLSPTESGTVVAARLASLARGYSGVRKEIIDGLCGLLNHRVYPCIPSEGSVGASGDLTPLSYVAATLIGEREVYLDGNRVPSREGLAHCGLSPLVLRPKEGLALMNGTSVMTGLSCLAFRSAQRLARWSAALTAVMSDVVQGQPGHFDRRIFELKAHPGQQLCAEWIAEDIEYDAQLSRHAERLQDRYSIRCAPHVIGVLLDFLPLSRNLIETELNSVNDNPILDPDTGDALHGGNFYGGHICFVMDGMKNAIANLADLLDRQLALLCNPTTNNGLPPNLVARSGSEQAAHHGFKAMQITASALTAEALKLTMPASVFSRSTENHNQDKVSMGTIAARDCLRVIELVENAAAIHTLALCQAVDLRGQKNIHKRSAALHSEVRKHVPINLTDRAMDKDIVCVAELFRQNRLPIGDGQYG